MLSTCLEVAGREPKTESNRELNQDRSTIRTNRTEAKEMDDLPELPFEAILTFLNLEDRLKARAVSRSWRKKFDKYPVEILCYSEFPRDRILGKNRLAGGAFAQNFIRSTRFTSFFDTLSQSILKNLKHLRLCNIRSTQIADNEVLARSISAFGQLERLDIFSVQWSAPQKFKLNLEALKSINLKDLAEAELTMNSPQLKEIRMDDCEDLQLELVHANSVEWLHTSRLEHIEVENLKNLKYLYCGLSSQIDATFLSSLEQLKEVHLQDNDKISSLFEQKQRLGRADLKIYFCGLLLNGPDDPAIQSLDGEFDEDAFRCLAENPSRLADELPFRSSLLYAAIERVEAGSEDTVVSKLIDLEEIIVGKKVQDAQRFLDLLKKNGNIVELNFLKLRKKPRGAKQNPQQQQLFDRLPEHCAVQKLTICWALSDFEFISKLKHLIHLDIDCNVNHEVVRKAFQELQHLCWFDFKHRSKTVKIDRESPKKFCVFNGSWNEEIIDLESAIQLIFGQAKRKAEEVPLDE